GVAAVLKPNNDTVAHFVLLSQCRFQVVRVDVHPFARHDDVLLAALEIKIPFGIKLAEIASAKPSFVIQHRLQFLTLPVAGGNVGPAHQDFASLIQLDLAPLQHLSDRAPAGVKWMVQRDQRSRLRQAVALNDDETQPAPELLGFRVERRSAGDEGPELPSELIVDSPEAPPASHEVLVFRRLELTLEPRQPA